MIRKLALSALTATALAIGSILWLITATGRALASWGDLHDIFDSEQDDTS